jgi:hypothetical protein
MAGRIPDVAVMTFALFSVALLMGTGVRTGVSRKTRTSFRGAEAIEDSKLGEMGCYRACVFSRCVVCVVLSVRPLASPPPCCATS